MRFLAFIGALAIVVAIGAAIYFFGGFYSVAQNEDNPAVVDWALASIRGASVAGHATEPPPASLDDSATVKAGARAYATIGCVNCHGGPPNANWAKWSEGLKPVPADLKVMAKDRTASQLFWAIKSGILIWSALNSGDRDLRNSSSFSRSPTRTANTFFIGSQYGGIDLSSVTRLDGPTMSTAQQKTSGVNVTPTRAA